jgi:hypothetical protein
MHERRQTRLLHRFRTALNACAVDEQETLRKPRVAVHNLRSRSSALCIIASTVLQGEHTSREGQTRPTPGFPNGAGYGRKSDHSSGLRRGLLCILSASFVSLVDTLVISSLIDDGLPRRQRATSCDELITFSR